MNQASNKTFSETEQLTLRTLLAITLADVDIFLLQDETQTKDLEKEFTTEEIRNQLLETMAKICSILEKFGYNIDQPLLSKISYKVNNSILNNPSVN